MFNNRMTQRPQSLLLFILFLLLAPVATFASESGFAQRTSPYPVDDTLDRLEAVLQEKGVTVFARIDHGAGAQEAGLELPPMQLLIFGHPKAGTPLMQAAPSSGLDLPLKVLVWEDAAGQTQVIWNTPTYVIERHGLDEAYRKNLAAAEGLINAALQPSP